MEESFYHTVINSPQWQEWRDYQDSLLKDYKEENKDLIFDFITSEETDTISAEHFEAFLSFCRNLNPCCNKSAKVIGKVCHNCWKTL